jgi:hypothetical protein
MQLLQASITLSPSIVRDERLDVPTTRGRRSAIDGIAAT